MVHQYKNNGYNIVMDINSGAIHVVDDVVYDVIALYEDHSRQEIREQLSSVYSDQELEEAFSEIEELVREKRLFTEDNYQETALHMS